MDEKEAWIDDALNTYPLAPVPPGLRRRVMAQIAAERQPPAIAFRLDFLDFAVPAFIAFFVTLALSVGATILLMADPIKLLRMQLAILVNTLIFTVLFRGHAGSLASWERALGLWVVFSTLSLHRPTLDDVFLALTGRSLRESDDARYLAMCMPRFLGRLPYGPKTSPAPTVANEPASAKGIASMSRML